MFKILKTAGGLLSEASLAANSAPFYYPFTARFPIV